MMKTFFLGKALVKEPLLAVGARNDAAFLSALGRLNPNPATQLMSIALLRVHASGSGTIHTAMKPLEGVPESVRAEVWAGFAAFDGALMHEGGEEILRHGFLNSMSNTPSRYEYHSLPKWTVEDFISSWTPPAAVGGGAVARL